MTAQINLRKLTGINIESGASNITKTVMSTTNKADFATKVNELSLENNKIVFAGQDYKGTFTASGPKAGNKIEGSLELYLERPENHFTIKDVKINVDATSGTHTFKGTGKDGGATIVLAASTPTMKEEDSGWFTTELTATPQTLRFGEWSNYDLSNQPYVDISFV